MTNPDNIVRVRARNGGRASVYEANGWAQAYSSGLFQGNGVTQNTSADMNVLVGGSASKPDVVLAENPAGYKFALDLVGQQAVAVTAPASNSRISSIVAYTDDLSLATTEDTVTGSPASCGLIVVNGTASVSPSEPTDAQIRTAITADGATGSQAAYCVIATILVANTTTVITDSLITIKKAQISASSINLSTMGGNYSQSEVATGYTWDDGSMIYKKTVYISSLPNATTGNYPHSITNLNQVIKLEGFMLTSGGGAWPLPQVPNPTSSGVNNGIRLSASSSNITIDAGTNRSTSSAYVTLWYTKTS